MDNAMEGSAKSLQLRVIYRPLPFCQPQKRSFNIWISGWAFNLKYNFHNFDNWSIVDLNIFTNYSHVHNSPLFAALSM